MRPLLVPVVSPWRLCLGELAVLLVSAGLCLADDWPQWRGVARDGVWRETGIVRQLPDGQLPIRWRVPLGSGYCGPSVAAGRVYVADRREEPEQVERVHCFAAQDGRLLWTHQYRCDYDISYTAGPRATITVEAGRAFALGAMGHLHCLDAVTGKVLWDRDLQHDFQLQIPTWGIAAAPLVHEELLIVHVGGRSNGCIVALEKATGRQCWTALSDRASYSAPILVSQAGQTVCVCWTGDSVSGLDPRSGRVHWSYPFKPRKMPIGVATPLLTDGGVFVSSFYDGSLLLRLDKEQLRAEKAWQIAGASERQTDALHCMISTPLYRDGYIYGVDSYGELRCLDERTGQRIWEDRTATPPERWSNIHLVWHEDEVWMFNEAGQLIIGRLTPEGFKELSRAQLLAPTRVQLPRGVCWSHPAFADRHVFARNDQELVCASLAADE